MPKYRPETEKALAEKITSAYLANGCSGVKTAKQFGVTKQNIYQQLAQPAKQQSLAEYFKKQFNKKYLRDKVIDGLESKKIIFDRKNKRVETPDHHCRHKYLTTVLQVRGDLSTDINNNITNNQVVIYRNPEALREDVVDVQMLNKDKKNEC